MSLNMTILHVAVLLCPWLFCQRMVRSTRDSSVSEYIKDIYFFEGNTKHMSSNVLNMSVISRGLRTREIADIFNT